MSASLASVVTQWASLYANHAALRTAVLFAHIGGLLAAGGAAIAADRATLIALRRGDTAVRRAQVEALALTHGIVLGGLTLMVASGLLMFAADVDTFLYSRVFWIKMSLVVVLLVNGAILTSTERLIRQGVDDVWGRLRFTSAASLWLWFLIALAGVALTNAG